MKTATLQGLLGRKLRTALTALSIVLGVAMVSGTFILTDTMKKAFDDLFTGTYKDTGAVISGKEIVKGAAKSTVPESLQAKVAALPDVGSASGAIFDISGSSDFVKLIGRDGKQLGSTQQPNFGWGFEPGQKANPTTLKSGEWAVGPNQVVIDAASAKKEHYKLGDKIGVSGEGPQRSMTVSGIARFGSVDSIGGATFAVFDAAARRVRNGEAGPSAFVGVVCLITLIGLIPISLNGIPHTIVGVLPRGFRGLTGSSDVWVPLTTLPAEDLANPFDHSYTVVARRKVQTSAAQADADARVVGTAVDAQFHDRQRAAWSATALPLDDQRIDPIVRRSVLLLLVAVVSVLLIVCFNLANLTLFKALARRREVAIRLALGASRFRIVRQQMTESALLGLAGGVAGLAIASVILRIGGLLMPDLPMVLTGAASGAARATAGQTAGLTRVALDFDASRDAVLSSDLGQYRIVHLATHSLLDNQRPELSGVVLSLVDRSGRSQNGFLRLYDIYNLRLGADLVVLSACQTARGGEIEGEGLIGLTRGFLYAGAPRVVATLWAVDDRTTALVMKHFYEGMLVRGQRPAAALRSAQAEVARTRGWDPPFYWAAFTLQGEWR